MVYSFLFDFFFFFLCSLEPILRHWKMTVSSPITPGQVRLLEFNGIVNMYFVLKDLCGSLCCDFIQTWNCISFCVVCLKILRVGTCSNQDFISHVMSMKCIFVMWK